MTVVAAVFPVETPLKYKFEERNIYDFANILNMHNMEIDKFNNHIH